MSAHSQASPGLNELICVQVGCSRYSVRWQVSEQETDHKEQVSLRTLCTSFGSLATVTGRTLRPLNHNAWSKLSLWLNRGKMKWMLASAWSPLSLVAARLRSSLLTLAQVLVPLLACRSAIQPSFDSFPRRDRRWSHGETPARLQSYFPSISTALTLGCTARRLGFAISTLGEQTWPLECKTASMTFGCNA